MFAHCYKQQGGWESVLARWPRGGGTLLDLEFLTDANGRRVAAFGYHAGFAGAALALQVWAWQKRSGGDGSDYPSVKPYPNEAALLEEVRDTVGKAAELNGGKYPRVIVIGALGRCGSGAVDAALKAGVPDENVLKWDMAETASGGPFPEILECISPILMALICSGYLRQLYLPVPGRTHVRHFQRHREPSRTTIVRHRRCFLRHHKSSQPNSNLHRQHDFRQPRRQRRSPRRLQTLECD